MKIRLLFLLLTASVGCVDSGPAASRTDSPADTSATAGEKDAAQSDSKDAASDGQQRDNTGVNVRDRDSNAKTPVDQFENAGDIEITAGIRSKIVATEMSVAAHNVKIITQYGRVTLRGPVRTEQEKKMIEDIAKNVAGSENVDSQLDVARQ